MTQVNYHLEFDTDQPAASVREVLTGLAAESPFPRLRLHDRRGRFAFARSLLDNQRRMRESGVPTVVLVISAFIHFFVVPTIMALFWLFSLPDRLIRSTPEQTQDELPQYLATSDRPIAITALPFVVQQLSDRLGWSNVVVSTMSAESEPTEDEPPAPCARLSATELAEADEGRLLRLVGSKIEIQP